MKANCQNDIKNLIPNFALVPWPLEVLGEIIRWQVPFLRRLNWFKNGKKIGKIDLDFLKESGYDGIELTLWGLFDENWDVNQERLKKYKEKKYPFYTFHACFESFPRRFKNVYLNLAEKDPKIKKAIKAHINLASELKKDRSTILVFHPGKLIRGLTKKEALRNLIDNLSAHLDYAKKNGVILTIENMPYHFNKVDFCQNFVDFQYIFSKIQHPNLKMTFDWGHLNTQLANNNFYKYNKTKDYYKDGNFAFHHINNFVNAIGKNIVHTHVHYNRSHKLLLKPRAGFINKTIIYLFFWTKFAQSIRKRIDHEFLDEHLSFEKIEDIYLSDFEKTIKNLLKKTSILDYGFITHEIAPLRIFKFFKYQEDGAKNEDFKESLKIFNKMAEGIFVR